VVSLVKAHPDEDEIRQHLVNYSMSVEEIVNHYATDKHPLTLGSVNWYRRRYVYPVVEKAKENLKEDIVDEINEEWRRVEYRTIEMIDGLLNSAIKRFQRGDITINTVSEIVKLLELKAKVQGELQEDITIRFAWGDKLDVCPRFKQPKGHIYSPEDLNDMR